MRFTFAAAALGLVPSACAAPSDLVQRQSTAPTVRIMPLGDSITAGPGCWRAYLWQKLQAAGIKNTDFVGSQPTGGCAFTFDGEHEGHGGISAAGMVQQNALPAWLTSAKPDIVLIHLGTNDIFGVTTPSPVIAAFTTLLAQIRAYKATTKIVVAKIIPMAASACADCPARIVALNSAVGEWAANRTTSASPIAVVDCWSGFNALTMSADGIHPNDAGFQVMASAWYPTVAKVVQSFT